MLRRVVTFSFAAFLDCAHLNQKHSSQVVYLIELLTINGLVNVGC